MTDTETSPFEYTYVIEHANSYDWFYASVHYGKVLIAKKSCLKRHKRAGKWAARQIRQHKKGLAIVEAAK